MLERLLCRSFMQDPVTERRPYPSGGALYVIDPLLLVFSSQIKENQKLNREFIIFAQLEIFYSP